MCFGSAVQAQENKACMTTWAKTSMQRALPNMDPHIMQRISGKDDNQEQNSKFDSKTYKTEHTKDI